MSKGVLVSPRRSVELVTAESPKIGKCSDAKCRRCARRVECAALNRAAGHMKGGA